MPTDDTRPDRRRDFKRAEYEAIRPAALAAEPGAGEGLDAAYHERNAVVAALIRTNGWRCWITAADDAPGWWLVYAETPAGQVSWHVSNDDVDLFSSWVPVTIETGWDGHTTEEKYRRLARLRSTPTAEDPE